MMDPESFCPSPFMHAPTQDPHTKQPRIRPVELTVLLTCFIAASYAFGIYLFSTLLPDMRAALALTYTEIGWITGLAQVGFLAGSLFSASLVRRLGAVRLILGSVFACCVSLGLMTQVGNAFHITALMMVTGCTAATVWVPMVAVVQNGIATQHQGKVLGLISSGTAYGLFLNGWSVPALLQVGDWKLVWLASALLTLALLCWGVLRLRVGVAAPPVAVPSAVPAAAPASAHKPKTTGIGAVLGDRTAVVVLLLMLLSGIACMPIMNYLLSFLREEVGYSAEQAGWVWSSIGFAGMFGGFAMGALADRIGVTRAVVFAYALLVCCTALFLLHRSVGEVLLGAVIFGLAFNSLFGLIPAFVSLVFDASRVTTIFALGNAMLGLGSMLGNLLGGMLREHLQSFVPVFWGSLAMELLLITLSLYLLGVHRTTGIARPSSP